MVMDFNQPLNALSAVPWKAVFIVTLCLMALHTIFLQSNQEGDLYASTMTSSPLPAEPIPAIYSPTPAPGIQHAAVEPLAIASPSEYPTPPDSAPEPYIAICMAIRDQAFDLREYFVHHYYHIGIRRFYIMDDGSSPPLSTFDYPGVPRSVLTFVPQDPAARGSWAQLAIYARCHIDYGHLHKWIAYLDGDEFLETPGNETLREILASFENDETVGALAVNWRMHSSSGLLTKPESARKAFVHCVSDEDVHGQGAMSDNRHVKMIVRTDKGFAPTGPHMWSMKEGNVVGENGDVVVSNAFRSPITRDRVALHHYAVKSRQEYEEKMLRGNAMDDPKQEEFWDRMENQYDKVECLEMTEYDP